ncbi:MAG: hypothetical protein U5J95_05625 [Balneolaceae bacterium]|nr:hypothetical protein [Balneolaceae bacterium]
MFITSEKSSLEGEVKYNAIAVAQDHIDQIRWMSSESELNEFVNDFPKMINVETGSGTTLPYYVEINVEDESISGSNVKNRHITVTVRSSYLGWGRDPTVDNNNYVKADFIKSFAN